MDTIVVDQDFLVAVDIGATNTRVSLYWVQSKTITEVPKFKSSSLEDLFHHLNNLAQQVQQKTKHVSLGAVLAVAGPVSHNREQVTITNYHGTDKTLHVKDLPHVLFPQGKTQLLNDLEACCYGIMSTPKKEDYFQVAFASTTEQVHMNYAVLAMGTGLGCGIILNDYDSVLPLEAGHCTLQHSEEDAPLCQYLSKHLYNGEQPIEYEDICSGRGLKAVYEFLSKHTKSSHDIATLPDEFAKQSMWIHYKYLMRAAQNISVMIPSVKGVFLAGDNQVQNDTFFQSKQDQLREEFLDHTKREWMEKVTVWRQTKSNNFNVQGALFIAKKNYLQ